MVKNDRRSYFAHFPYYPKMKRESSPNPPFYTNGDYPITLESTLFQSIRDRWDGKMDEIIKERFGADFISHELELIKSDESVWGKAEEFLWALELSMQEDARSMFITDSETGEILHYCKVTNETLHSRIEDTVPEQILDAIENGAEISIKYM